MERSSSKIKKFLLFQEIKLSSSKIKKFLILLEMELSGLIFFLYFRRKLFELKKFKKPTPKIFFYFGKWNFLALNLKNSYFQEGTCKTRKTNKKSTLKELLIFLQKRFSSHFGMTAQKTFPYSEQKRVSYSLMYQLFFRTINLSLYPLLLRYSFFQL